MNLTSNTTLCIGGAKHDAHTAGYITSSPARYAYFNIIESCAGILAIKRVTNSPVLLWLHQSMHVTLNLKCTGITYSINSVYT